MARWMIEKSGTGIEKSGTGIEKSGTGIEKSGTGVERSGSGIEKAGTGIGRLSLAAIASFAVVTSATALELPEPEGSLQIVATQDALAISWIFEGSIFSGIAAPEGSVTDVYLTELSMSSDPEAKRGKTGDPDTQVVGSGSGTQVVGSGSGTQVVGSGSGVQVVGSGSGTAVVGSGSGVSVVGSGSGSNQLVVGTGSGREAITITLPEGTGLRMEVAMGCNSATVTLLDADSMAIAVFENQPVIGAAAATYCTDSGSAPGFGEPAFGIEPKIGSSRQLR